jgi:lon-related putative ATP-dependent protease
MSHDPIDRVPPAPPGVDNEPMAAPPPLPVEALHRPCTFEGLGFETTAELAGPPGGVPVPGQERAREAIGLGVDLRARGYNLYALGPPGVGKRTIVEETLAARAAREAVPADWCYVHNFAQPHRPRALRLPRGRGSDLRAKVRQLAEEIRVSIPALFDSDEYRSRAEQIDAEVSERQQQAFVALGEDASKEGIALLHTPAGFSLAPTYRDEVMSPEHFAKLPPAERGRLEESMRALQDRLQKVIRQVQQLQKEKRARIKQLGREMCMVTVGALIDDLRAAYAEIPAVTAFLEEVRADVLENLEDFRRPPDSEPTPFGLRLEQPPVRRYDVNVVVGADGTDTGAPVVVEDNPTFPNLLGRVEYQSRLGTLVTDFNQIKPGALHRANGGYLLLDVRRVLAQPFAWDALKRALRTGEIRTEAIGQAYGLVNTAALEPEPIPLDVKVVLFGDRVLYYLLLALDEEFGELFRIAADFEDEVVRTPESEELYARLIASIAAREGWLPLHRSGVARVVEELARWAGDAERLSTQLESIAHLVRESDHRARGEGAAAIEDRHVQAAIDAHRRRSGRIRERIHEAIARGDLLIDTDGAVVGQVNGLTVALTGDQAFAFPTRITANTRMGEGDVVDIQREVELSGPIHSKGVLILASLLTTRYSPTRPLSLSATLVFEQTYGAVDGDSASVAELCALLSAIGRFPLDQGIAVTGAIDQHGRVLPIGAVNEKIEGFFDVCAARGLTARQGVLIPPANVKHLMLRADVVDAVARGEFRVAAVATLDEALSVLAGTDAGSPDERGLFPPGTPNARVAAKLTEYGLRLQAMLLPPVPARRGMPRRRARRRPGPGTAGGRRS